MVNYATKEDIAARLLRAKPYWFHGKPEVHFRGKEGGWGLLSFDFKDQVVEFKIYVKDADSILAEAIAAVEGFNKIIGKLHEQ